MLAKRNKKLVESFLVPHLEDGKFGPYLKWINRREGVFGIYNVRYRKGKKVSNSMNSNDVFKEWSQMKNLWNPNDPQGAPKAKHRLRSALRRHQGIKEIKKENHYLVYQILNVEKYFSRMEDEGVEDSAMEVKDNVCTYENHQIAAYDTENLENSDTTILQQGSSLYNTRKQDIPQDYYTWFISEVSEVSMPSPTKQPLKTQDWEHFDHIDVEERTNYLPTCFTSTRCCDILLESKALHNQLCIWSE